MLQSSTEDRSATSGVAELSAKRTSLEGERPRVIYVMGAGRSGSTTLGITLGNCTDVFYAGELDNWLVRSGVPQVQDDERLRFWSKVRDGLEDDDRAVLKALGINAIDAQVVDFNGLIPGLNARQFDMVTAGMFINKARCGAAAFSDPDYTAPTAFLVPKGNPKGVLSFDDVRTKNLKLAVLSGAVEQGYAQKSGVPDSQVQAFDTQNSLLQAVATSRVDAGALTNISLNDVVSKNPSASVEVTKGFFPVIDGQETLSAGAFVFRKGDDAFVSAFNAELKKLHDSGEWLKIAGPFGFNQDNVPKSDVTTQRLCSA